MITYSIGTANLHGKSVSFRVISNLDVLNSILTPKKKETSKGKGNYTPLKRHYLEVFHVQHVPLGESSNEQLCIAISVIYSLEEPPINVNVLVKSDI